MGSWISAAMRSWSVPVGKIGDVHVRLHLSYLFLLICVWGLQSPLLGSRVVGRGLILVGLVLISVIVHELAHGLVARALGCAEARFDPDAAGWRDAIRREPDTAEGPGWSIPGG